MQFEQVSKSSAVFNNGKYMSYAATFGEPTMLYCFTTMTCSNIPCMVGLAARPTATQYLHVVVRFTRWQHDATAIQVLDCKLPAGSHKHRTALPRRGKSPAASSMP